MSTAGAVNGTRCYDVAVHQVSAVSAGSGWSYSRPAESAPGPLEADELTILTAWAEAVAEVLGAKSADKVPLFETVLSAASEKRRDESQLDALVRQVLRAMLEQRQTRQAADG